MRAIMLQFELLKTDPTSHARRGKLTLNHGVVQTPIFMPVGTYGTVKGVMPRSLEEMGAQIILGNTFHLWMRPGLDIMKTFGGLHGFEKWNKPILTDSGGFQVWSLGAMRKITEEGVHFQSPVNGDKLFMSPEVSMQIQTVLNSDIVMQLDECTPYETNGKKTTEAEARKSMEMSRRWAKRPRTSSSVLRTPTRCLALCRAACTPICARSRWKRWWRWTSPATPLAASPWVNPRTRCWKSWRTRPTCCLPTSPAT